MHQKGKVCYRGSGNVKNRRKRNLRRRRRQIFVQRALAVLAVLMLAAAVFCAAASWLEKQEQASRKENPDRMPTPASGWQEKEQVSQEEEQIPETASGMTAEAVQTEIRTVPEITEEPVYETTEEEKPAKPAAAVSVGGVPEPTYVTLVAVGDNLMHRSVSMSGLQADGSYNYDYNFSKVAPIIQAADIAVINQETVIGGNQLGIQGYPCFNGRTEMADALVRNGFDVVLGANNHILDQGAQGVLHMISYFHSNYPEITLLGIHESWETRDQIAVVEKKGIRIAMINYTDLLNIPSNWYGQEYLTDFLDYERLAALIQTAKASSDFVIVFPHWGTEYNLGTDAKQQEEVNFLAEQGVDLVIGTHPHVVEPVSCITRPDGKKMLIYYSLGNFQSIQNREDTMIGAMACVTLKKTYAGVSISDFNMRFLANDYRMSGVFLDYYDIVTTYPWEQYSRELAETSWVHHDNAGFNVDYMFQLEAQMQAQVTAERQAAGLE